MDEHQINRLRRHRTKIVDDLEPRGPVLDALCEDGILTENDIELVSSAKTRKERCHALLSLLPTRGPSAYGSFRKALTVGKYDFLADTLEEESNESTNESTGSSTDSGLGHDEGDSRRRDNSTQRKTCVKCAAFLRKMSRDTNEINVELLRVLKQNCCLILHNVEANDIIDVLFQEQVLSEDDLDLIRSSLTRRQRIERLVYILLTSRRNVVDVLLCGLNKKYSFIFDEISALREENDWSDQPRVNTERNADETRGQMHSICGATSPETSGSHVTAVKEYFGARTGNKVQACAEEETKRKEIACDTVDGSRIIEYTKPEQGRTSKQDKGAVANRSNEGHSAQKEIVTKQVSFVTAEKPRKRLVIAFNYLSTLINQGEYSKFDTVSAELKMKFPTNYDLLCILGYLNASRELFRNDCDTAKQHIESTLKLVPKTSNPRYFTLELFTAKSRMYITRKKLEKLQTILDEAMMILESDPVGCTGRAAGWLYINDARNKTAQMSCLNLRKPGSSGAYNKLFENARTSFQRAMTNFKRDGGKDGPFGFAYALCRLMILLLRCGDNGGTMGHVVPLEDDVKTAESYIRHLEESDIPIPKILEMHLRLAKCDYFYRRNNIIRALEHAEEASRIATDINMMEFTEHAQNRVMFLRSKMRSAPVEDEYSDDEVQRILFEDSSSETEEVT